MAVRNASVPSLIDIVASQNPDGTTARIAEILNKTNEVMDDMAWRQGNLPTGDRISLRTALPTVGKRRLNLGVPRSKATSTQVDEAVALIEASAQIDREIAILGGDPAGYRAAQMPAFVESMNVEFLTTLFYGNAFFNDLDFTGFMPRYNTAANPQVIDAGGTGNDNRSILVVSWDDQKVSGIVPKGTTSGLIHMDTTTNRNVASDGHWIGDEMVDANGNTYLGYTDRWMWRCGLSIQDPRNVVRIANIDKSLLSASMATGADIADLLVQAMERLGPTANNGNVSIYAPREITGILRRQQVQLKQANLGWDEIGGRRVQMFDNAPIRRVDIMSLDEARVV